MDQKQRELITYLAILSVPFQYLLIIIILVIFTGDGTFPTSFYVYLVLAGLTIASSLFVIRNARINELDHSKVITYLAVTHVPSIIGLTYFIIEFFIVM